MTALRIGTRESRLAMIQAGLLRDYIEECGISAELVPMKTTGDRILDRRLDQAGGKGLFVKELDRALREKRTDLSVHSAKDLPMEIPDDLPILGFSRREDPRDVLVLPEGCQEWDRSRPVGCSSRRRTIQLGMRYPGVTFETVRGNVLTRLQKLDSGEYGALILAAAGLRRLGLEGRIHRYFSPEECVPAAGQGVLCVQGRAGESYPFLAGFFDESAGRTVIAERAFVRALDGGCSSPVAAFAQQEGERLRLSGFFCGEDGNGSIRAVLEGSPQEPEALGRQLAAYIRAAEKGEGVS